MQAQLHAPSQRLAWVEFAEDFLHSKIVISNAKAQSMEKLDEGIHFSFSPHWHPSGNYLMFTSNRDEYENYELYVYDFSAKCIKRLTYFSTTELDPTFSPDGKQIYFSSNLNGSQQIYKMNFHPPESCPSPASTAKL
ncbi:MAG: PD40 domain-containing protein [Bdellovibrionaceae bacterium]|nr:PD40 domain-containing protein [Pseudobdellovibrionaceae bacterium]